MAQRITILFLCTGNSCRSQMAEGWAKALQPETIQAYSAGIEKHGLNKRAIQVMSEAGVDISKHQSTLVEELPIENFDWVITLCGHANETCPHFPGRKVHRGFDDPPQLTQDTESEREILNVYRQVRDEIRDFVATLPDSLVV